MSAAGSSRKSSRSPAARKQRARRRESATTNSRPGASAQRYERPRNTGDDAFRPNPARSATRPGPGSAAEEQAMGVIRFLVHPASVFDDWPEVHRAYISGVDQTAWATRIEVDGNLVICRRQNSDSGKLNVAWPVAGFGRPVLSTASLPERDEPYLLVVELARGRIVQTRNQLALW